MTGTGGNGTENRWDAAAYDDDVGFVHEYGESVVSLLDPKPGERILDLGCGTGHLTAEIGEAVRIGGGAAVGVDSAPDMIAAARAEYPGCRFECVDAREFDFEAPFDAVFTNAALHWISGEDQDAVAERVADALVPAGRFVGEFGGHGNVDAIVSAVLRELRERGYDEVDHPWYFPTIGEYATLLERQGFEVRFVSLFDRPTELDSGVDGLWNWLDVFGDSLFAPLGESERDDVVTAVEDRLRDELWDSGTETWTADYRRLRFEAVRV